jgi:16S rRNA (uracil1498-N3)-methyltransferase
MHRFFISPQNIEGRQAILDESESRHALTVMRLKPGDKIILFDGEGASYQAFLQGSQGKRVVAVLEKILENEACPAVNIHLVQGLPKGEKMELIVQKAVEIGVHSIYPLQCRRSIAQLKGSMVEKKLRRWESIAREACKQSGRNRCLTINPALSLTELLAVMQSRPAVALYERERTTGYKEVLRTLIPRCYKKDLFLLVGPEGGWDEDEIQELTGRGVHTASLGSRVLRTETAGLVASALALYEAGDLGTP